MVEIPHRRLNILTNEWILVSPHRTKRPWQGQVEKIPTETLPHYDPSCYLCPGNERAGGIRNPQYDTTFVFENDYAALLPIDQAKKEIENPFFQSSPEFGKCLVVCFSPRHDLTIPEMEQEAIYEVIRTWAQASSELSAIPQIKYVQVFENKGALMGSSNPHPHSQIWSQSDLPNEIVKELKTQKDYFEVNGRPLLLDYLEQERKAMERILFSNASFTALVPWWASWPFETLICAHRAVASLAELSKDEMFDLAEIYQKMTICYDNLFEISFPYSMGFHQAPNDGLKHPEWVLHAHFYPPLLRSATIRKFMVGYEMMAMPQRDVTPESAADRLRSLPTLHYKKGNQR